MNRRQELAVAIAESFIDPRAVRNPAIRAEFVADAVLEHLDTPVDLKPADLEAMGDHAAVEDRDGDLWQRRGGEWCSWETSPHSSTRLARFGPFRILHIGKAES